MMYHLIVLPHFLRYVTNVEHSVSIAGFLGFVHHPEFQVTITHNVYET
jgi:hypothetical protein